MFSSSSVSVGDSTKKSHYDRLLDNTQYNKGRLDTVYSGTNAFNGPKTFDDIHSATFSERPKLPGIDSSTSTSGVSIQSQYVDLSSTISLVRRYKKTMEIGDWNMDTIESVNIAHGLGSPGKIRNLYAIVRRDNDAEHIPINFCDANGVMNGRIGRYSDNINVWRRAGGSFDSSNFTASSFNRGWITIEYEE